MSQQFDPYEPLPDHLADTGPIRRVQEVAPWRRAVGFVSLLGAAGLTIATALLILRPNTATPTPNVIDPTSVPATVENVVQPSSVPQTNPSDQTQNVPIAQNVSAPLDPGMIAQLMATPIVAIDQTVGLEIARNDFSAFTIVPDRPRSEVIQYTIQAGDTIFGIAERFGLKPETIAWSNDRAITEGLRPGKNLNILPVDGVYFTVSADTSIENIAKQYHVDPYTVIDSEYNDLFGDTPDTELPSGAKVVLPGGTAEQIAWTPPVQRISGTSSNGRSGDKISFDIGDPGSCGLVDNPGGGGGWLKPLAGYQWVRGFSSVHSGVDLSAPTGTAITAANGGEVMFAGWSNWGYGYSVVIASGPYSEVYGHMSAVSARCGTYVQAGQVIGAVGMTGNASGPHLHFEIRYNDIPTDPTSTMPF
jgi:murein DD-endopeptidase MepM/ murein hydrolase activator NlpD